MQTPPTHDQKVYFTVCELARRAQRDYAWLCKDAAKRGYPAPAADVELAGMLAATKLGMSALAALVSDELPADAKADALRAVDSEAVKAYLLPYLLHEYKIHEKSAKKAGIRASQPESMFQAVFENSVLTVADFRGA
jgi:hypothetical protein